MVRSNFWFHFMFLALGILTTEGKKIITVVISESRPMRVRLVSEHVQTSYFDSTLEV